MFAGLSDTDCQVAMLRHHQMVADGERQWLLSTLGPAATSRPFGLAPGRDRFTTIIAAASACVHGMKSAITVRPLPVTSARQNTISS